MYNIIDDMYEDLAHQLGNQRELCSCTYNVEFDNFVHCADYGIMLWHHYINDTLIKRRNNEVHFHNFLKHQLFARLQEIKAYSNVNIADTRRLIAVSHECISSIQILIREKIHLNVYFRSSDIDGALPADLKFITELPAELIVHLEKMRDEKGYSEVTNKLMKEIRSKEISLTLMFGSLHRTA